MESKIEAQPVENPLPAPEEVRHQRHDSALERIGTKTAMMMVGCLLVEIAAIGFLAFMWYGTVENKTWHSIVAHNWVPRAVTLTSLALRIAIGIQGATCLSMLAAITLETLSVPFRNVAEISLMRSGNKTDLLSVVLNYLFPVYKSGPLRGNGMRAFVLSSAVLLLTTLTLSQFASTALLSDVQYQLLPGRNITSRLTYDYLFTNSEANPSSIYGSGWYTGGDDKKTRYGYTYSGMSSSSYWISRTPNSWPAFAEYSEAPFKAANVDDTGVSLRSFFPFVSSNDRSNIRNYTGKALVFDSRVTCQKPKLTDLKFANVTGSSIGTHNFIDSAYGMLSGTASPTVLTPRMIPGLSGSQSEMPFSCSVASGFDTKQPWTICQLATYQNVFDPLYQTVYTTPAYGLKSMLRAESSKNQTGSVFLLIGNTLNSVQKDVPDQSSGSDAFAHQTITDEDRQSENKFSVTLCFTSYDVADRYVEAYGDRNRSEPTSKWDVKDSVLDMSDVVKQLNTDSASFEERGVLHLKSRKDWTDSTPDQNIIDGPDQLEYVRNLQKPVIPSNNHGTDLNFVPYVINAMNVQGTTLLPPDKDPQKDCWGAMLFPGLPAANADGSVQNWSKQTVVSPEWVTNLFNALLAKSRPAVALQALLTSMAGIGYYDRVTQYTKSAPVGQVFFQTLESPGGPNGTKRTAFPGGFVAVIIILLLHLIICGIVVFRFFKLSKLTRIGDGWQAIAHVALSDDHRTVLEKSAARGGRSAVEDHIRSGPMNESQVGVRARGGGLPRVCTM